MLTDIASHLNDRFSDCWLWATVMLMANAILWIIAATRRNKCHISPGSIRLLFWIELLFNISNNMIHFYILDDYVSKFSKTDPQTIKTAIYCIPLQIIIALASFYILRIIHKTIQGIP